MPNASGRKGNPDGKRLAAIDQLLIAGIKQGPAKKRDAINRILELVPEWTRGDCWQRIRHLRKTPELAAVEDRYPGKAKKSGKSGPMRRSFCSPWTPADDDRLLNLAGYEPVRKIAQRLGRSVSAVRFRLGALGMSARVTDGWSLRALRTLLRVSPTRLRYLIGTGLLRVRDARISATSLTAFCEKNGATWDPSALERVVAALNKADDAFSWERAADLLGVALAHIPSLISAGQLKLVDSFVTDRSFEEFCRKHGNEINTALMDPATAKWLVSEYGVANPSDKSRNVSRAQKHVLIVRTCACGRKIAGNAYFRHVRTCQTATTTSLRDAS